MRNYKIYAYEDKGIFTCKQTLKNCLVGKFINDKKQYTFILNDKDIKL